MMIIQKRWQLVSNCKQASNYVTFLTSLYTAQPQLNPLWLPHLRLQVLELPGDRFTQWLVHSSTAVCFAGRGWKSWVRAGYNWLSSGCPVLLFTPVCHRLWLSLPAQTALLLAQTTLLPAQTAQYFLPRCSRVLYFMGMLTGIWGKTSWAECQCPPTLNPEFLKS